MSDEVRWISPPPNDVMRAAQEWRSLQQCHLCSALVATESAKRAHEIFHATYIHGEKAKQMSSAAWCDPGNHAFKAGEPGSQHFQGTSIGEDGRPISQEMDACATHSFQPQPKTLTSSTGVQDA